ncbi:Mediator of DNA damage checkpoint protein 1 [Dissostichus eleginoides]|uniref:Mediator of DNA damage checkpoint protein 1 n=1 Tax=Dissostichus eleginoides TaxID=100907 RepID=A0AAD9C789_DISEL|nr:Mediator of DNA damage checkpoint protein 1 [Dissostichus eleginoides]
MDATQRICDSTLESDEEDHEDESENKRGRPLAKLCILKNAHIPETEVPLFLGENVLGRDPNTCTVPLIAPSISKQHATICLSVYRKRGRHSEVDIEALVWDQGSMNGTCKGQMKLTPNVRYALSERDSLVVADIPCQYVSCAEDAVSSQGDVRTPVSRHSGVKATLLHATSTGGKKYVNGGTGARVSLPDQEDTMKTPGVTTVLSFEQTPTYPEGSLVPESDSDSDGERGERRRKAIVSDSDSHESSPRCSTFLSPTNKTVPESEDESPITPSSSTKNRPHRHVSFSLDETDMDAGRQQLNNKKTVEIVDDSAEEEQREEERTALGGTKSEENTAQFHMDSDTDVDEDDDALDQVPKSLPSSADLNKPHVISVIQPEGVTMDSDTDVDDDAMSDAATNAKPPSLQSTQTADSAFSTQVENVHLDSDTDVDEDEEMKRGTNNKYPEIDETPTRLDIRPESIPAAPDSLQLDSDTDDEAIPAPALGEPSLVSSLTESWTTAQSGADLDFLSDSDTDVEEDSPLFIALVVSDVSVYPGTTSDDADPDVDESIVPRAGDAADLKEDSDTDVEDAAESQIPSLQREISPWLLAPLQQNFSTPVPLTEGGLEDMDTQAFISPSAVPYRRAVAPAVRCLVLSASSGSQEDEDFVVAETQSFVLQTREREGNPPQDPGQAFSLESSGDERGEQSSREASFQFGLSDSKHLQGQALAMENTQAFVGGGVSVEDTLAYAAVSNADRTSLENDPHLEAKQAYGKEAEPARCSEMSAKESQVDSDLEDTQEFITMPNSDSEDDTDDDESRNTATADTQAFNVPTSSTLAMAETQLMPVSEEDESSDEENLFSAVLQVKREEGEEDGEADQPQKKHHSEALSVAETQPMHISEDEESDDEDLISGPRKRNAKPLQLDEEQTHTLSNSELSLETQPMATSGNEESDDEESDDEDLIAGPRKRKAKQLWLDEEQTQTLSNSELSLEAQPMHMGVSETQPMHTSEDEESDDEDSMPGPRKRKAKPLQLDEEETQTLSNSELSAPMVAGEDEEIDDEDSILEPEADSILTNDDVPARRTRSRSNSSNSVSSERSASSLSTQGGRGRGQGAKRGSSAPPPSSQHQRYQQEEEHGEDETEKADPQQAPTTRGRRRANVSEPIAAEKQDNSSQECASGESPLPKRNVRGRAVKSETVEAPVAPAVSEGDQESRKGRKRHLEEANTEESSSSSHKVFKGKEKAQTPDLAGETKEEIPVPAKRRGRASTAQTNKIAGVSSAKVEGSEKSETIEEVAVKKRGRGRPAVAQKKMKEEQEESGLSVDHVEASEPQTPTSAASRKRQAPADSSPVAKTPRSSSASPGGRLRYVSHAYKVLFTGVVDEEGERVLARLGGSMAKGVADMNCLVTDKVRRTVKFLCAVAKGIPIATTHWLDKSCKAGSFLSPDAFVVKDPEQEKKFSFCLQESLRIASSQPLLQGYQIHVTKSVKPEPVQMKDIIFCSGATLLPKMPSSPKPQTVVISCEEDLSLCGPALSASLPVVTAEFLLTGILQQRLDLQTHRLSAPAHSLQPARGRGRGRKKT